MLQLSGQHSGVAQASQAATSDKINAAIDTHAAGKKVTGSAKPAPMPMASKIKVPVGTNKVTSIIATAPKGTQGSSGQGTTTAVHGATAGAINKAVTTASQP